MLDLVRMPDEDYAGVIPGRKDAAPGISVESHPIRIIEIDRLVLIGSPRSTGEDPVHTRALAEIADLPPVLVHRATMQVIDGMHRVRAALLNGRSVIKARLVDCDSATAFVLAVRANVTHGLPLSPQDRRTAAEFIIALHPNWSDRAVAAAAGLSDKTVSALRAAPASEAQQPRDRIGRDGRVRPLNSAARRRQAAVMIAERPDAGLREIARATGLSPATVRDVRLRTDRGEDPVPAKYREAPGTSGLVPRACPEPQEAAPEAAAPVRRPTNGPGVDGRALLAKLMSDPSLRFSEAGRVALRWLHHHAVDLDSCRGVGGTIPDHWSAPVADLARSCATAWLTLADELDERR
ncbi:ParB N-terminal domain-containing protein [Streptomyces sp. NBC_01198]|uniref:ParB N-terminal domain-containing protein n=1 Tax=Streptomyces sp. NBC_01198 TaxID=2903769 RepID=UPI002E144557|nr:ParB N-terminal domain-containing protein [Streptomyces sp. NBC_01198]